MIQSFNKIDRIKGELILPGDKSISHRAVIFSCLAKGKSVIENLSEAEDVKSTAGCFAAMGCGIEWKGKKLIVEGKGLTKPLGNLDAGNSGTTSRLLTGILAVQNFESTIIGDESLSKRPMKRVIAPLSLMGAKFEVNEAQTLPLKILPSNNLHTISYELPVASAQVKSAILLAGLHLKDETCVIEKEKSRDHTERMLNLRVEEREGKRFVYSSSKNLPVAKEYFVPSDVSTAAFFIVFALCAKNSSLTVRDICLNETRTGIITILKQMGARIEIKNKRVSSNEEYGDIYVESGKLKNVKIDAALIPSIIDEIPVLSVAGLLADGDFEIRNSSELRVKESDRIESLCYNYKMLGLTVEEFGDGFKISGAITNNRPVFESFDDHRIAMAFAILSMLLKDGGKVNNFDCVKISNPRFLEQLKRIIEN
jgi:3-phosphoshikimate 1-carboxyvinyltransferase